MKISIIIPVYNVAPYVEECIQSVLDQDYENMEVIIVDDCGMDNSMELVKKTIAGTTKTICIYTHQNNRGLSAARNTGIMRATGDYLYFLDSDDYIDPDCISSLVKVAQTYPKLEIIIGSSKAVPDRKIYENITERTDLKNYYDDRSEIKKMMLDYFRFPHTVWNRLIRRDWLLKHSLFFKEGIIFEDFHWNFFAAKYVTSIALYKKNTYNYRLNPSGIIHSTQLQKKVESYDFLIKDWIRNLDSFCLHSQIYPVIHLAHTCYVIRHGGAVRPTYIRIFYPFVYLVWLFFIKRICKKERNQPIDA